MLAIMWLWVGSDAVCCLLGHIQWMIQSIVAGGLAIMKRWDGSDAVTSLLGHLQWIIQITYFMYGNYLVPVSLELYLFLNCFLL